MKVYTSYYAMQSGNPKSKSISLYPPTWYYGRHCAPFTPPTAAFAAYKKGYMPKEEYFECVMNKYRKLSDSVLERIVHEGDVYLCYEKDANSCHRSVLAEFLREKGYEVEELREKYMSQKAIKAAKKAELDKNQLSLFD